MIGAKAAITWSAPRCNHMTTPMAEIIWNAPGWNHMTTSLAAITWSAQRCNHMTTPLAEITWSALGWNHMRARRGSYDWSFPVVRFKHSKNTPGCPCRMHCTILLLLLVLFFCLSLLLSILLSNFGSAMLAEEILRMRKHVRPVSDPFLIRFVIKPCARSSA